MIRKFKRCIFIKNTVLVWIISTPVAPVNTECMVITENCEHIEAKMMKDIKDQLLHCKGNVIHHHTDIVKTTRWTRHLTHYTCLPLPIYFSSLSVSYTGILSPYIHPFVTTMNLKLALTFFTHCEMLVCLNPHQHLALLPLQWMKITLLEQASNELIKST